MNAGLWEDVAALGSQAGEAKNRVNALRVTQGSLMAPRNSLLQAYGPPPSQEQP